MSNETNCKNFFLNIEDSGVGIPPVHIDAVKKGVSLKHTGKGLGLVNSIKFFESLDGTLTLKSTLNLGTKIIISLPITPEPNYLCNTIFYKQNCVFVVLDDDETIRILLARILKMHHIHCETFASIKEFNKWHSTKNEQENFILLCDYDLHDGQFNGIDVIKNYNIKERSYLMTSHAETAWMQAIVNDNCIRLISKSLIENVQFICVD